MASRNNKRKIHPDRNVLNLCSVVLRGRSPLLKKKKSGLEEYGDVNQMLKLRFNKISNQACAGTSVS